MAGYRVEVLKPGYTEWLGPDRLRADGTITLVTGPKKILVDTGSPWERQVLLDLLSGRELCPEDIDCVVCTHGHSDHVGNLNLFSDSIIICGQDISQGHLYTIHDFRAPYQIDNEVEVIATPGHTCQDVSVIVRNSDRVTVVVGDLFECEADRDNQSLWRSMSTHPDVQEESRNRILAVAEMIVPGHGAAFAIAH